MVVMGEDLADGLLQVGKIDDHAALDLSFNREFDFIGVAVQGSAFRVAGQKMRAIDVFGYTEPHGVRIAQGKMVSEGRLYSGEWCGGGPYLKLKPTAHVL